MKFAKSLLRNEVPEWAQWYIDYKGLKKLVNQAVAEAAEAQLEDGSNGHASGHELEAVSDRITAPFFFAVDRNAELVDNFYNSKFAEYSRRLRHVEQQITASSMSLEEDESEKEEIIRMLLELRSHLRNLQWYAEVNKRGFTKILKKFDKKVGTQAKVQYLSSKILILGFSNGQEITDKIDAISARLEEVAPHLTDRSLAQPHVSAFLTSSSQKSLETAPFDALRLAIEEDDADTVRKLCIENTMNTKQIVSLVLKAISIHADKALEGLVDANAVRLAHFTDDINRRNILHRAVISEGRRHVELAQSNIKIDAGVPANSPHSHVPGRIHLPETQRPVSADSTSATSIQVLLKVLSRHVSPNQLLLAIDHQLRTPAHYAVQYGMAATVQDLLAMNSACLEFSDADSMTPLDLAVIHKFPVVLGVILSYNPRPKPQLLLTAALLNAARICEILINAKGYDVNYGENSEHQGETALHVASKHGHLETVKTLISKGADLEARDTTFDWTPLFLAAVDGSLEIAKVLISAGARADITDNSGWTAKEHAALRGHLDLAKMLPAPPMSQPTASSAPGSIDRRHSADNAVLKTFGHRYLEDSGEYLVLVTLGSRDLRKRNTPPVEMDTVPMSQAGKTQLDTALSLVVSSTETQSEPYQVSLPVPELGLATEPIPFFTKDPSGMRLLFDLIPTYSAGSVRLARGVYILPPLHRIQDLNNSAQRVPIIEASSLNVLGTVHFEVLIVKPFVHPNNGIDVSSTYWRSLITTRVIGHRGLGKNTLAKSSLQLGENTVESFIQAANLGASYVEFDVQLTKDGVPVIYHDFLVGDSGFDIPMHSMTLDQFMNIQRPVRGRKERKDETNPNQLTMELRNSDARPEASGFISEPSKSPSLRYTPLEGETGSVTPKFRQDQLPKRSRSVHNLSRGEDEDASYDDAVMRMRYTRDFQTKGFKGNVRGLHIQSKFATLEELFKTLPKGLGFNIECKYPMLDEAESEDMDGTILEINYWVDTVLKVIYDHKADRDIILSSFNPDVCILLSLKQPSIPVLFLTEGGTAPMMDIRASSLQEAIRFSKRFNLLGIVSEATPLIMCPRLVRAVKESGLTCFTYGSENNVPENARTQLNAGVDAVIVDSVLAIRKELTEEAGGNPPSSDDILVQEVSNAIKKANLDSAS